MRALRPPAPVVVGADHACRGRHQREHGIPVLRDQVDAHAAVLRQGEGIGVGGMIHHEAGAAGIQRPGPRCRQVHARFQGSQRDRLTAGHVADGERIIRRAALPPSHRGRFDQVDARLQVALYAGVEPAGTIIIVGDAAAICGQQVQVGIGILGHEVDADAAPFTELEAIGMGIAPGAEARVAAFRRPATGGRQLALWVCAEGAEITDLAVRMVGQDGTGTCQHPNPGKEGNGGECDSQCAQGRAIRHDILQR